jgi:hypothetical protein
MSPPPLWMSIEPEFGYTQLLLSHPGVGTLLQARLSPQPAQPGGVSMLLEALSAWEGKPLYAVLDADAEDVQAHPERWSRFMGEAGQSPRITIEWNCPPGARLSRSKFFKGDFTSAKRLIKYAATGQQ